MPRISKKLVSILAISMPVVKSNEEIIFERIQYIYYLVWFSISQKQVNVLFNTGNKVNIINFGFIKKLSFKI